MQFYISVMFLGLPDKIDKEKPTFLQSKKNELRTDGPTNGRPDRPSYRDARTHLKTFIFVIKKKKPTDGWTDQRTDRPSYRDARMHLKTGIRPKKHGFCGFGVKCTIFYLKGPFYLS